MQTRPSEVPEQHDAMDRTERTRPHTTIPEPSEPAEAIAPDQRTQLVIRRGPGAGTRFVITQDSTTLGRHRDCDIVLDDVTISRRHAVLSRDTDRCDRYVIADLGSLNGIYVNRQLADRVELADGDELWIGKFHFTFHTAQLV